MPGAHTYSFPGYLPFSYPALENSLTFDSMLKLESEIVKG